MVFPRWGRSGTRAVSRWRWICKPRAREGRVIQSAVRAEGRVAAVAGDRKEPVPEVFPLGPGRAKRLNGYEFSS
eukprot:8126700-Lingulodinium_polyedra.AAC.1